MLRNVVRSGLGLRRLFRWGLGHGGLLLKTLGRTRRESSSPQQEFSGTRVGYRSTCSRYRGTLQELLLDSARVPGNLSRVPQYLLTVPRNSARNLLDSARVPGNSSRVPQYLLTALRNSARALLASARVPGNLSRVPQYLLAVPRNSARVSPRLGESSRELEPGTVVLAHGTAELCKSSPRLGESSRELEPGTAGARKAVGTPGRLSYH